MSREVRIFVLAMSVWALQGWLCGYLEQMPGIVASTPDARDYLAGASYRLPLYGWIANIGPWPLVILQALAFAASCALLTASTGTLWAGLLWAANMSAVALTFHALTESFAVLAVCVGLYAVSRRQWLALTAAGISLMALRPIVPLPMEAFRKMATINEARFAAQAEQLGAVWAWFNNILSNCVAWSNFTPRALRLPMLTYNSALWLLFSCCTWRLLADLRCGRATGSC